MKKLEELGIGRPSTYASIISVISNRGYAEINNKRFFPTDRGKLLSAFLEKLFSRTACHVQICHTQIPHT